MTVHIPYSGDTAFKRTIAPVAGDIFEVAVHFGRAPSTAVGKWDTFIVFHILVGKWEYAGLSLRGTILVLCGQEKKSSLR